MSSVSHFPWCGEPANHLGEDCPAMFEPDVSGPIQAGGAVHSSDCLCLICVPACAPPTKAEFDALPARWRRYVADLETNADPAGRARENAMLKDQIRQLGVLIEEERERHRKDLNEEIREARRNVSDAYTEGRWAEREDL